MNNSLRWVRREVPYIDINIIGNAPPMTQIINVLQTRSWDNKLHRWFEWQDVPTEEE